MSLFPIRKEKVMSVCENIIKDNNEKSRQIIEKLVDAEMNRNRWLSRFKPKTREEAWEKVKVKYGQQISWCGLPSQPPPWYTQGHNFHKAEELLKACSISDGDIIQLNINDANFIEKWL